jgi:hypothetical protein
MSGKKHNLQSLILNREGQRALTHNNGPIWTFWSLEQARNRKGRLRYHLGQIAMIRLVNALLANGCDVRAALCDADHLTMKTDVRELWRENIHASERFIDLNTDSAIKRFRMSELIQNHITHRSKEFLTIRESVMEVLLRFRDAMLFQRLSEPALQDLAQYRFYPPPKTPHSLEACSAALRKTFAVPEDLLLTLVYLFFSRPNWFSAFWQADFTACMALEGKSGGILLEAHRNAYAWRSMECIVRISQSYPTVAKLGLKWPRMAFFKSLPAIDGDGFMKLDIPTGCIFLDASPEEFDKQLSKASSSIRRKFCEVLTLPQRLSPATTKWRHSIKQLWLDHRNRSKELLASTTIARTVKILTPRSLKAKHSAKSYGHPLSGAMFDVFLCHNNKDKNIVESLAKELCEAGIRPWFDKWEIRPGSTWQEVLEDQIESVRSAAVFIGPSKIGPWQNEEIRAFLSQFVERKCPVIPVFLKRAPAKPKLPIFLKNKHHVDFRKNDPDPFDQLLWGIKGKKVADQRTPK